MVPLMFVAGGLQQSLPVINKTPTPLGYINTSRVGVPVTLAQTSPTSELPCWTIWTPQSSCWLRLATLGGHSVDVANVIN